MWSSVIAVHPWIGTNYENPAYFKYKTLILGESNYTNPPENFNSTLVLRCIEDDLDQKNPDRDSNGFCRFSTKIRRVIFGRDESLGPAGLWNNVAFYNFVQALAGDKSRIRPSAQMWMDSVAAFIEIVEKLQPSRILVLGKANWRNVLSNIRHEPLDSYVARLIIGSNSITAGYINHPSSALAYATWQPITRQLLFP